MEHKIFEQFHNIFPLFKALRYEKIDKESIKVETECCTFIFTYKGKQEFSLKTLKMYEKGE